MPRKAQTAQKPPVIEGIADTDIADTDIGIGDSDMVVVDTGTDTEDIQEAEEPARELAVAEANREVQAVGTRRTPQRATQSS